MKIRLFILAILFATAFSSCLVRQPLVSVPADNNQTYQVDYLFEHDGCKVYRFRDEGNYIYFTNCSGNVTEATSDSTKVYIQTITQGEK